jgi:repressor LexA
VPVPLVGRVTAGQPILAEENIQGVFPLPKEMVPESEVFMLKVQGNSMIEAGIFDGDYVIVKVSNTAENGDIVVALLGDEATVKRFFKESDHIRLQPENRYMEPIIVKDVKILGKVIGLFRRF